MRGHDLEEPRQGFRSSILLGASRQDRCGIVRWNRPGPSRKSADQRIRSCTSINSMNELTFFKVGETYTNDQIRFALDLENLGGIRPSLDSKRNIRHVAILTAAEDSGRLQTENPYHDRIEAEVLIYTAQGREGD